MAISTAEYKEMIQFESKGYYQIVFLRNIIESEHEGDYTKEEPNWNCIIKPININKYKKIEYTDWYMISRKYIGTLSYIR